MKKKLCLQDVLNCVYGQICVQVVYSGREEYTVLDGVDPRSVIPGRVQQMSVLGMRSRFDCLYIRVGTWEEVHG